MCGNFKLYNIPDFAGYLIDVEGNVYSIQSKKVKKLAKVPDTNGYHTTQLTQNGVRKRYKIHRLMAKTFLLGFYKKPQVNHKNGIKTDNRLENLEMCTAKENTAHAISLGLCNNAQLFDGKIKFNHKLTPEKAEQIRDSKLSATVS